MEIVVQGIAARIAEAEYIRRKRATNAKADSLQGQGGYDRYNRNGVGAEIAVAMALNIWPNIDAPIFEDWDLISRAGHRIDVKGTELERGHLVLPIWQKDKEIDFYIFVIGAMPLYRIVGVETAAAAWGDDRIVDLGNGKCRRTLRAQLQTIEQWIAEYETATVQYVGAAKRAR